MFQRNAIDTVPRKTCILYFAFGSRNVFEKWKRKKGCPCEVEVLELPQYLPKNRFQKLKDSTPHESLEKYVRTD